MNNFAPNLISFANGEVISYEKGENSMHLSKNEIIFSNSYENEPLYELYAKKKQEKKPGIEESQPRIEFNEDNFPSLGN